jgi:hypothetical protein
MSNPCMPGVFKIGMTTRSPMQRCVELSNSTSAPVPFALLCYGEILEARQVELDIHEMFQADRVNIGREFFSARFEDINTAIRLSSRNFCLTHDGRRCLEAEANTAVKLEDSVPGHVRTSETLQ